MKMSPDENVNSVVNLLDALPSAPDKYVALQQLKTAIFAIHPTALDRVVPNVSFNIVFECLETEDVDQIEVCCSLLTRLLSAVRPAELMAFHEMQIGLTHPNPHVYSLTLDCIQRGCEDSEAAMVLARRADLLKPLVAGLASEDGDVTRRIRKSLVAFGQHQHGRESLLAGEACIELKRVQESNSTNRYRVFECVVGIAAKSAPALEFCAVSGFLDDLLGDLDGDDVLAQLNCVSLLADLSAFEHGLHFLERIGTVAKMESLLNQTDTDPMASLLLPGIVKFFGNLMYLYPEQISSRWSSMVSKVIGLVPQPDPALAPTAIDTLGLIGSSPIGKTALNSIGGNRMNVAIGHMGTLVFSSATSSEIRIRTMESLEHLFKLPPDVQNENLLNLTQSWFAHTSSRPMAELMRLCQLPFLNVRCAALSIIKSIADQPWGQRTLKNHPGFQEYILNRETESEIQGWTIKYSVIQTLVDTPTTTRQVFGDPYFMKLRAYSLEGVFYSPTETEVATMEL